jgi:DHA2 family multidrug resistance protein-like MFS transporter
VLSIVSIIVGLVVGVLFVQRQRGLTDPLIDLRLFRIPAFSASLAINTTAIFVGFGSFLFIAQYLQLVLGLSPLEAGLWSVPGAIASIAGSNIAPVLVRRIRPALVIALGMVFVAIGFGMIAMIGTNSLALVVIGNTILSVGFGFTFTLTSDMIITTAPPERAGAASGISETSNELGGSLGIAILGSFGLALYRSQIAANVPASIPAEAVKAAQETLGGALATAGQLGGDLGTTLLTVAREAFTHALQVSSAIGFVVVIGLGILAVVALRNVSIHSDGESEAQPEVEQPERQPTARPQREMQVGD